MSETDQEFYDKHPLEMTIPFGPAEKMTKTVRCPAITFGEIGDVNDPTEPSTDAIMMGIPGIFGLYQPMSINMMKGLRDQLNERIAVREAEAAGAGADSAQSGGTLQ